MVGPLMIDAHLHLVDFRQRTDGLATLIESLDCAGIEKAVIFGLPVKKEWSEWERLEPTYYLSDNCRCYYYSMTDALVAEQYQRLSEHDRQRLLPLVCGFNPVDKHAVRHIEQVLDIYPNVFRGVGEILCRHDDLTNQLLGQPPRANHPALSPIYSLAAAQAWPVLIHQDMSSVGRNDEPAYLREMEEAVRTNPEVTFVWAHGGHSRRVVVDGHLQLLTRLMEDYDNLCLDYSWKVYEALVCQDGDPKPDWVEFTATFSNRICLGSDIFGRFEELNRTMHRYAPLLDALNDKERQDVSRGTALRVYGGEDAQR